jgi:hypothetical protein
MCAEVTHCIPFYNMAWETMSQFLIIGPFLLGQKVWFCFFLFSKCFFFLFRREVSENRRGYACALLSMAYTE